MQEATCQSLVTAGSPLTLPLLHLGSTLLLSTTSSLPSLRCRPPVAGIGVEELALVVLKPPTGWAIFTNTFLLSTILLMLFMPGPIDVP